MVISIGNKIKQLRKQRGITLIPTLASFFRVSIDELFDYRLKEMQAQVKAICEEAYQYRESDPERSRAGLRRYPDNDVLLNNLLYVLNYRENPDETIRIASQLISETNDDSVKYDPLRFLAYAYHAKGDDKSAKTAINQIPEIYFSKLSEAAFILKGDDKFEAAEKEKWISFEILLQMCAKLSECYEEKGDLALAIKELQQALDFITVLQNEDKIKNFDNYAAFFKKEMKRISLKKVALDQQG